MGGREGDKPATADCIHIAAHRMVCKGGREGEREGMSGRKEEGRNG